MGTMERRWQLVAAGLALCVGMAVVLLPRAPKEEVERALLPKRSGVSDAPAAAKLAAAPADRQPEGPLPGSDPAAAPAEESEAEPPAAQLPPPQAEWEPAVVAAREGPRLAPRPPAEGLLRAHYRQTHAGEAAPERFDATAVAEPGEELPLRLLTAADGQRPPLRRLEGWVEEHLEGGVRLRGWFESPAGVERVDLPLGGRWVRVRVEPAGEEIELLLESVPRPGWRPPRWSAARLDAEHEGELDLWVPAQAAALVGVAPDGRGVRAPLVGGEQNLVLRLPHPR